MSNRQKMSDIGIGKTLSVFMRSVALVEFDYLAVAYVGAVDGEAQQRAA